ncbi:tumor necrosis factor receptor superfamily member 5-like isoform X5 [Tachysurus fulvidraco]|uniref:tumor necrosis factor receptor superfamily member 5-like isoform X5 n=1 Tax=Tachysurus fulvidraco TaxID=1234273 RepID=UPI001FEE299D|nr:tumor necrosis factor receptor superfamily member 5-like isoform X5 [Tachysurus fulvidraco]
MYSDKIMKPTRLKLLLNIFGICATFTYGEKCGQSEYRSAADECCPMCAMGFYISQDCTSMQDTVCGVLDGFYCIRYSDEKRDCSLAIKHTKCKPGEQIKTPGTKASDTICEPCSPGFYSPEGVNCSKWTDCTGRNEIEDEEGTSIRDVQCKPRNQNMRYGFIAVLLMAAVVLLLVVLYLKYRLEIKSTRTLNSSVEETGPQTSVFAPSTSPLAETQETELPDFQPDSNKEHIL